MNLIKEEPLNDEIEEKTTRRKDKFQTHSIKKVHIFKSFGKEKRGTVFIKGMKDKKEMLKKNIFSDKQLDKVMLRKIRESIIYSSVFDMLGLKDNKKKNYDKISYEYKKYEQKLGFSLPYKETKQLRNEPSPEELTKILNVLSLPTENRTFYDVYTMKKYLSNTKIDWLFKDKFEKKEESIEKLLTFFGLEMKYRLFKEGEEVFKVGDNSIFLYLIIKGRIEILKPTPEINFLSGYDYFSYIMKLKNHKEEYLLNINLEENFKQFDIDKNDIDLLPAIFILHNFELIKMKKDINLEEELAIVNMTLKDLDLTQETVNSYQHLSSKLEEKLPFVPPHLLKKYKFIIDKKIKKKLKIIKYTKVLTLGNNEFFGESAMGENEKRNATIRVLENSYLGYLSANLYKTNFFEEKKQAMQYKINFLNSRFFFKYINPKRFAKKYFNLFVYEKYLNGTILFKENERLTHAYFIEDGLVELTSTKTMLEMEIFLRGLEEKFSLINEKDEFLKYKAIKSQTKDLEEYLNKTQKSKILILGKNETLGIESFFYGIPYYATARVVSQRAKIFKISVEQLSQILNIEKECISSLRNLILNKTKILRKRLFSMNNIRLVLLDNKIIFNYEFDFNINFKDEEKNKTEKNILFQTDTKMIPSSELKKNKFLSLSPINNSNENHLSKKRNFYLSQNDRNKNRKHLLIKSMSTFYKKEQLKNNNNEKELKLPSFEEKLLNHAKKDIKILINEPQFISLFNDKIVNNTDKSIDNNSNNSNINDSNKKEKSTITDLKNKTLLNNQIQYKKINNSIDSFLPSISSNRHLNRNFSNINNNFRKKNYSYSLNLTNEKNKIKSNFNSYNQSKIYKNYILTKKHKESPKSYIKLVTKRFNNFYRIKNDYNKKKYRFYNDKEIFGFNKSKKDINIEINNYKEFKNKSSESDLFKILKNQNQLIKNKEIISRINEKNKLEGISEKK